MKKPLLCKIGLHNKYVVTKWIPSIFAEIVTGFEQSTKCARCGKEFHKTKLIWDGKDMIDAELPLDEYPENGHDT